MSGRVAALQSGPKVVFNQGLKQYNRTIDQNPFSTRGRHGTTGHSRLKPVFNHVLAQYNLTGHSRLKPVFNHVLALCNRKQ
eukprot:3940417-Rhodomonas_salina.5